MAQVENRLENLKTLRTANTDGAFANAFANLSAGSILIGFIKYLGGSDIWIGVLAALPSVLGLLQIPGAIIGRRYPVYKKFVYFGGFTWRLFYVPLIFLPMLPINATLKLTIIVACVCIASAASLIVNSTYNEWLAALVPASSRGYFYSRRNAITSLTGAVAGLMGGIILDVFKGRGQETLGFTTVFALGSIFSAISLYFFHRMSETRRSAVLKQNLGDTIRQLAKPLVDKNYRAVLMFTAIFIFGQSFSGNFFTAFALESLKLPFTLLTLLGAFQAIGTVISSPFWGFLADKYGNKPVLILSGLLITATPTMWLFTQPNHTIQNAAFLLPSHVLVGCVWAGVTLTQFNIILATSPEEERANYIGIALTVQAITGFVSPLIGAETLSYLRIQTADPATAYKLLFGTTMALRFVGIFFIIPVVESGALRVRTTLRDLSRLTPRGMQAMRALSRSSDVPSKEAAIRNVAHTRLSLAGDELIKALHDPSPRIRRQAAASLARLGDPTAVSALLHQLEAHPDLIEEELIDALGRLAGPEAVPPLSKLLKDPRSLIRRTAARALGRIGDRSAIPALAEAAGSSGDADVRRASLQALRSIGADDQAHIFADALLDPLPSVRIAAAEGVAELHLIEAADRVRESLLLHHDEASSEVAYALGAVGGDEDVPLILTAASECVSIITRRRCLLGLARLLGVESEAYKLLLLDGMSRDAALLDAVKPLVRKQRKFAVAMNKFSSGNEAGALQVVAQSYKQPLLNWLAREPVEELFYVVVCYLAKEF